MEEQVHENLLHDIEYEWQEDASKGLRFANYLIDLLSFYGVIFGLTIMLLLMFPTSTFLDSIDNMNGILSRLLGLVLFGLYMTIVEGISKGKTLGKLITGTRAVRQDNQPFTWTDAFQRGLSRMVPFEPLSALFGVPWHDHWTDTRVIKERR